MKENGLSEFMKIVYKYSKVKDLQEAFQDFPVKEEWHKGGITMQETPDIIEVRALEKLYIYLKFDTGEEKIYDMTEHIEKIPFFNKLKERKYFEKVKPRGNTIEWENGEDVAPENLYHESIPIEEFGI